MSDLTIDPAATDIDVARARLFEAAMAEAGHPVRVADVFTGGWGSFADDSIQPEVRWRASQIAYQRYPIGRFACLTCFLANASRSVACPCEAIGPFTDDCGIDRGEA